MNNTLAFRGLAAAKIQQFIPARNQRLIRMEPDARPTECALEEEDVRIFAMENKSIFFFNPGRRCKLGRFRRKWFSPLATLQLNGAMEQSGIRVNAVRLETTFAFYCEIGQSRVVRQMKSVFEVLAPGLSVSALIFSWAVTSAMVIPGPRSRNTCISPSERFSATVGCFCVWAGAGLGTETTNLWLT